MIQKIKRFYVRNKWISRLGILSMIITLSYAITYYMPDYLGIEPYYSLLNNLAISYIAALGFYVVQVYIVEERNIKICMEVLQPQFADLARFVEVTILVCREHIHIKDKGAELSWNGGKGKLYVKYSKCGDMQGAYDRSYTIKEILNLSNVFKEKIKRIKETPVIHYCDYEILEKLSEFENCSFYDSLISVVYFAETELGLSSFNDSLLKIESLNSDWKMLCSINACYKLEEIKDIDKGISDLLRGAKVDSFESIEKINETVRSNQIKQQIKEACELHGIPINDENLDEIGKQILESSKQ